MRNRSSTEDNLETLAHERIFLQAKKKPARFYIIRNKMALIILTRLVFMVLMLFSAGVITTSIWLMMECRESFTTVRPMLPRNIQFCTNMGMPALFACCTVLFAIFGLGCTGRRLTGYALIIISSVEILQSVTALTFYSCSTMSRQEITRSVNSSVFPCYMPAKSLVPFVYGKFLDNNVASSYASPLRANFRLTNVKRKPAVEDLSVATEVNDDIIPLPELNRSIPYPSSITSPKRFRFKRRKQSQRRETHVPQDTIQNQKKVGSVLQNIQGENLKVLTKNSERVTRQRIECTAESRYFWNLSQRLKKSELSNCMLVCKAYKTICPIPNVDIQYKAKVPALDAIQSAVPGAGETGNVPQTRPGVEGAGTKSSSVGPRHVRAVRSFDSRIEECGYMVYKYVSDLCFYDNKIILPLSLCAPLLCIAMSACFIYLAYCDRRVKEDSQSNICIQVPGLTDSKASTRSLVDCCLHLKQGFKTHLCCCRLQRNHLWRGLVCCTCCPSLAGQLDPECSNSTHELLHLRAMASSGALSPAVSQYTLNASVTDDCSPILPRWS